MMDLAAHKVKEGSLLDAAEIARYVMILTCAEYEADHPYGEQYGLSLMILSVMQMRCL